MFEVVVLRQDALAGIYVFLPYNCIAHYHCYMLQCTLSLCTSKNQQYASEHEQKHFCRSLHVYF